MVAALSFSYAVVARPAWTLVIVLSLLPPLAPILMSARMAVGDVAFWQVVLAMGLLLGSATGLTVFAGRIYSNSILRTGSRVPLRDALRAR